METEPLAHHYLFADGSSLGNPGPSGWGAVLVHRDRKVTELGGKQVRSTNNAMELEALRAGLDEIISEPGDIMIFTDSRYVHDGATKWLVNWERRGWVTREGNPVENLDRWKAVAKLLEKRRAVGRVHFRHVPGHSGVIGNERCDVIATSFAKGLPVELFEGTLEEYADDILNVTADETKSEARVHDRAHARAKAHSYVSEVGGDIRTHATWAECEARVKGKKARYKKALTPEEEEAIIASWK